jgi:hypothetical protein
MSRNSAAAQRAFVIRSVNAIFSGFEVTIRAAAALRAN